MQPFQRAVVLQYVEDFVRLTESMKCNYFARRDPTGHGDAAADGAGTVRSNHDGKLDADERENLLRVIQTMMPQ